MVMITLYARQKKRHRCIEQTFRLWEKARVGWSERIALKHLHYQMWNRSPVQVGCMRQVLRAGALEWPRGMGWGRRWEGGSRWGTHVNQWLIHVNVWQKPLQYHKIISLQLIKINERNTLKLNIEKFVGSQVKERSYKRRCILRQEWEVLLAYRLSSSCFVVHFNFLFFNFSWSWQVSILGAQSFYWSLT